MIAIRPIQEADLPALSVLLDELSGARSDPGKAAEIFRIMERQDQYLVLGAFCDGRLAGTAMGIFCLDLAGACRPFMVVENVAVSSGHRRKGIGRQLMLALEEAARQRGCYYMILVSGKQRMEAHRMYESLGYKNEGAVGFRKHFD